MRRVPARTDRADTRAAQNSRAFIHNIFWIPSILAALILIFLPYANKIGHICAIYVLSASPPALAFSRADVARRGPQALAARPAS
jgi:hypothetical protein